MVTFALWLSVGVQDSTNFGGRIKNTILESASSVQTPTSQVFSFVTLGSSFYVSVLDLGFLSFVNGS